MSTRVKLGCQFDSMIANDFDFHSFSYDMLVEVQLHDHEPDL